MTSLLIQQARIVGSETADSVGVVDVRIEANRVVDVGPSIAATGPDRVIQAEGRWIIPGLWDHHVHMGQWAKSAGRLQLDNTESAAEVLAQVSEHVNELRSSGNTEGVIMGAGFRTTIWQDLARTAELDAITAGFSVVLISGDGHCAWLNSRAYQHFGRAPEPGLIDENPWFEMYARLGEIDPKATAAEYSSVIRDAHSKGIVGITDLEYEPNHLTWPARMTAGIGRLRVRAGFYPDSLDDVLSRGLRTNDTLAELVRLGPLKIISDGSMSALTAYCCEPYAPDPLHPRGKQNYLEAELVELLTLASENGLEVALHAIGDAAIQHALNAFEVTGARGSIEHAQLMRRPDVPRMAHLGIKASVQPAHLLDDRLAAERIWADRADRCFLFGSMRDSGVAMLFGSDAPVAKLDPWLAIDAAVNRAAAGEQPWNSAEQLTPAEALFASTDGAGPVSVGSVADLVLLDDDPLTAAPRDVHTALTMIDGDVVFDAGEIAVHLR